MDAAESLATTEDFVASETETELSVNDAVFPQPQEGSLVVAGWYSNEKKKDRISHTQLNHLVTQSERLNKGLIYMFKNMYIICKIIQLSI